MLLEYGDDMIAIDAGLMFPEEEMLGVDLVIPDVSYIEQHREKFRAIFITHGHEDHTGGLPYVLRKINAPIYCTPLAGGLIGVKLKEHHLTATTDLRTILPGESVQMGVFRVEAFQVAHSIPDSVGYAIKTPVGTVIHTGDFKLDHTPVMGQLTDLARLASLGDEGVLLLLADSTYAEIPGYTPSERVVGESLKTIIQSAPGRVIVATFASLIARVQQIIDAAEASGRRVFVTGRSMMDNTTMARDRGYLNFPRELSMGVNDLRNMPDEKVVIITTGSQGEPTSALTRMANRDHRQIQIVPGDTVVISAAPIPGNEELVHRTIDNLFRLGANVLWGQDNQVHVSGHAGQEELKLMLSLVKPKYFVPIHGEYRHLILHARLAQGMGLPSENIFVIEDGDALEFDRKGGRVAEHIPAGYVFVDGLGVGDVGQVVLRDRQLLSQDGILIVTLTVDRETGHPIAGPEIISRGFVYTRESEELIEQARNQVFQALEAAKGEEDGSRRPVDWQTIRNRIRDVLSKFVYEKTRRRPMILPLVMEV